MARRSSLNVFLALLAAGTALGGCASGRPTVDGLAAPRFNDDGILLAESYMLGGSTGAAAAGGATSDCAGPGLGIVVAGSTKTGKYLYDANGEPCEAAELIFDGRTAADKRAADPTIALVVHDSLGGVPFRPAESLNALPEIKVSSQLLESAPGAAAPPQAAALPGEPQKGIGAPRSTVAAAATAPQPAIAGKRVVKEAAPPAPDPLLSQLTNWKAQDKVVAARMAEADAAASRNLENIARQAQAAKEQDTIAQLAAKLRERERQIQEEQRRLADTIENSQAHREKTAAARQNWQQRENALEAELSTTRQRLQQFEALAAQLQAEKAAKEQSYQSRIMRLSGDLKAAEQQAEASRRELIIQAAAKIAEAEQLSHAAQLQEQEIKLREAERLKAEAETMMDRALALKAGQTVREVMAGVSPQAAKPLETVELVVHEKNQPLDKLVDNLLKQAAPQAGVWKADWQLSGKAQYILKEKWSLTAEAPLQQVLAQLAQQVQSAHGIALSFNQFAQSRLLVITDIPAAPKK